MVQNNKKTETEKLKPLQSSATSRMTGISEKVLYTEFILIPKKTLRFVDMSTYEKESFPCQP